jgi:hypothetical protein
MEFSNLESLREIRRKDCDNKRMANEGNLKESNKDKEDAEKEIRSVEKESMKEELELCKRKMDIEEEDEDEDEQPVRRKAKKCKIGGDYHEEKNIKKMEIEKMNCHSDVLECKKMKIEKKEEKVEFSNKDLILTQDIFDGCWNLNPQTKILIEKNAKIYEKIENLAKEKNLDKEEIKVTLLVLYYLSTDSSINKIEYSLIMKKGIAFLEKEGINFEEILSSLK